MSMLEKALDMIMHFAEGQKHSFIYVNERASYTSTNLHRTMADHLHLGNSPRLSRLLDRTTMVLIDDGLHELTMSRRRGAAL